MHDIKSSMKIISIVDYLLGKLQCYLKPTSTINKYIQLWMNNEEKDEKCKQIMYMFEY